MDVWPPSHYLAGASDRDVDPIVAQNAVEQARAVQRRGFPAILSLAHLAWHTSARYKDLRRVVERRTDPYRLFRSRKHSGGYREICVPEAWLGRVQRWLHEYVLSRQDPHPSSYAYTKGSTPARCAQQHLGCRWLVKVDVRRFFESISEIRVFRVYRSMGYEPLVSFELSRLVTRCHAKAPNRYKQEHWRSHPWSRLAIPSYKHVKVGHLPQGAPTSPLLSNLAVRSLDERLYDLAEQRGMTYTRYSDDLHFSATAAGFRKGDAVAVVRAVYAALARFGMRPQTAKTNLAGPGSRRIVLGLLVNGDRLRLSRDFRDRLRQHLHYLERFGPREHAEQRGFRSVFAFRRHLEGVVEYVTGVEREFGAECRARMSGLEWPL